MSLPSKTPESSVTTDNKTDGSVDSVTERMTAMMGKSEAAQEVKPEGAKAPTDSSSGAAATTSSSSATTAILDKGKTAEAPKTTEADAARGEEQGDEEDDGRLLKSKYNVTVTLADQQADPDSPLYSVKSFDQLGLTEELLKGIYSMKYQKPSKIQERALPLLLQNPPRNMIGQSQSGTGKTAAFVLTMLSRVDFNLNATQAIALAPSRELARQIMDVVQGMGKYTKVKTAYAIPDAVPSGTKIDAHIVVGTPGKTFDLIKRKQIDTKNVKVFVLDEADNMLDQQGLGEQSLRVKK